MCVIGVRLSLLLDLIVRRTRDRAETILSVLKYMFGRVKRDQGFSVLLQKSILRKSNSSIWRMYQLPYQVKR